MILKDFVISPVSGPGRFFHETYGGVTRDPNTGDLNVDGNVTYTDPGLNQDYNIDTEFVPPFVPADDSYPGVDLPETYVPPPVFEYNPTVTDSPTAPISPATPAGPYLQRSDITEAIGVNIASGQSHWNKTTTDPAGAFYYTNNADLGQTTMGFYDYYEKISGPIEAQNENIAVNQEYLGFVQDPENPNHWALNQDLITPSDSGGVFTSDSGKTLVEAQTYLNSVNHDNDVLLTTEASMNAAYDAQVAWNIDTQQLRATGGSALDKWLQGGEIDEKGWLTSIKLETWIALIGAGAGIANAWALIDSAKKQPDYDELREAEKEDRDLQWQHDIDILDRKAVIAEDSRQATEADSKPTRVTPITFRRG